MTAATARSGNLNRSTRPGWANFVFPWRHCAREVRGDQLITAIVGVASAVLGACFASFGRGTAVAAWVGVVTLCVTPGCAIVCWQLTRDRLIRLIAVLGTSLTWSTLVTTALAWLQVTSLGVLILSTAGVGGLGSGIFLLSQLAQHLREAPNPLLAGDGADERSWSEDRLHLRSRYGPNAGREDDRDPRRGFPPRSGRGFGPSPDRGFQLRPRQGFDMTPRDSRVPEASARLSPRLTFLFIALVFATALWIDSIVRVRGHSVGVYGLLPVLGAPFIIAVIMTIGVLVVALLSIRTAWPVATVALGLLVVELNATPMFLASGPLGNLSTYEHFGVVDYLLRGKPLNDPLDVYQQWPGFFAVAAGLVRLTGETPMGNSNWAQLFFEALNALVLFEIARRFSRGHQTVPYVTVLLFETVSWEGQFYYSPQTMAFTLALLFTYFLLPLLEIDRLRRPFARRDWLRLRPLDIPEEKRIASHIPEPLAIGLMAVFVAITIMHQLSPYFVFAGVVGLWILGVFRRPRVVAALAVMLIGYPLLHFAALAHNGALTGFNFAETASAYPATNGFAIQLQSKLSELIGLGFWLITGICALSYRRRIGVIAIPIILAVVPFSLILLNSYGGEAINRVFLFSSPWCALIIAMRLGDAAHWSILRWSFIGWWALLAAVGSAQVQDFGLYSTEQMTLGEVQASSYFLNNAPQNAMLVLAVPDFPARLNWRYVLHNVTEQVNDPLANDVDNCNAQETEAISSISPPGCRFTTNPQALAVSITALAQGSAYLVISPSMYRYVEYAGDLAPGSLSTLIPRLKASPYWEVWYDDNGVIIFHALPQGKHAEQTKHNLQQKRKGTA
jgi:hypothetical protein